MSSHSRIALLTFNLDGGGAERVMVTLANSFHRAGHPIDLLCIQATGPYLREVNDGINVIDLASRRLTFALPALVRYLRRVRPKALLSTMGSVNIVAAVAHRLARVATRLVVREAINPSAENRASWMAGHSPIATLRRWAYQSADLVVAPSQGVATDLVANVGLEESHVTVISNPLDIDRIEELSREPAEHLLCVPPATPVVVGIGRLSAQKDFATLIQAFARLRGRERAVLLLLGEGEERASLERLSADLDVTHLTIMPGFVENPFAYLRRSAVYVPVVQIRGPSEHAAPGPRGRDAGCCHRLSKRAKRSAGGRPVGTACSGG